ncbi:MAG TPA: DUF4397 domain-containing protein [Deinococcales bacterium]|nr:DUF4397 domain-containing protein [Deinococcales bacterium]
MKPFTSLILAGLAVTCLASSAPQAATVTVLLASPVDARLSLSANNKGLIYPLEYKKRSGPHSFAPGRHQFGVKVGSIVLNDSSRNLSEGSNYLLGITGPLGDLSLVWVKLDLAPAKGEAKLRLVNLMPDVTGIALKRGSDTLWENAPYRDTTASKSIAPGTMPIEVTRTDTNTVLVSDSRLNFEAGKTYTLIVFGPVGKPELLNIEN